MRDDGLADRPTPPTEEPYTSVERGDTQDARESIRVFNEGANQLLDRIEARIVHLLSDDWESKRQDLETAIEALDDILSTIEDQMFGRTAADPDDYEEDSGPDE